MWLSACAYAHAEIEIPWLFAASKSQYVQHLQASGGAGEDPNDGEDGKRNIPNDAGESSNDDNSSSNESSSDTESSDEDANPKRKRGSQAPDNSPSSTSASGPTTSQKDLPQKSVRFQQDKLVKDMEKKHTCKVTAANIQKKSHKSAYDKVYGPVARKVIKIHNKKNRIRACTWFQAGTCHYRGFSHHLRDGREVVHACKDCYHLAGIIAQHKAASADCPLTTL